MEVVVRSEAGEAEMHLLGDRGRHTLGDLAERVIGPLRKPARVGVDDHVHPLDVSLEDAGVRRGSVIDFAPPPADAARSTAGRLLQVAGHGAGATVELHDGEFRLGPTVRLDAEHLQPGPVTDPAIRLRVQGQLVEVEPVDGTIALLTGRPLTKRRAWTNGELVVADRVFIRSRHRTVAAETAERAAAGDRRHLTPIPVGHSLELHRAGSGERADGPQGPTIVSVDPVGGLGIVAQYDDAVAILRGIVLELAERSWPHGAALGVRTARPAEWEWTKWLPCVDTPTLLRGATTSRTRPSRHVVVIDDGTADEDDRHRHADYVVVIAAATSQDRLAPGLATVVHAVGGDHLEPPSAVSVTAISDGSVMVHPRVAPFALPEHIAVDRARRRTRSGAAASSTSASADADTDLRLVPWTVARAPTAWERLLERRSRPADAAQPVGSHRTWPRRSAPSRRGDTADPLDMYERLMRSALVDEQRVVLPVGVWSERQEVASIPLHAGRRLAVIGPRRSGRSELLATMADGVRRADADLEMFVVAPRGGALAEAGERLELDVASGPAEVAEWCDRIEQSARPLVFVDGADRVGGPSFTRLVAEHFDHAAIVMTFDAEPGEGHWSDRWQDGRLTVRLDGQGRSAIFDARHRRRRFDLVERPTAPTTPESNDTAIEPDTTVSTDPTSEQQP